MNLAIIGTGYVGLVSGTSFAEMGNQVTCVDIDEDKVEMLRNGTLPIFEPDLERYFGRNQAEGRLHFTTDLAEAVADADILFMALPTPPGADGAADLSYVLGAAGDVADLMAGEDAPRYRIVVNKSTVPVGTGDRVQAVFEDRGFTHGEDVDVVSNPEFLREGVAVSDFMKPERVVIGTASEKAAALMTQLYEPFVRQGNPILTVDRRSAEMIKYAANSFLATKITFMNEVANLCERVGANVDKVRLGIGLDSRIGKQFLYPGIGFGGSCFPKDVQALVRTANANDYDFRVLQSVLDVNEHQRGILADRIKDHFGGDLSGRHFAVWGLAFKPNTDDVREAPSHVVIRRLLEEGATVSAFDPEAAETTRAVLGDEITYAKSEYDALSGADALVICTEWHEFRRPNFDELHARLKQPLVFDGRNLYEPKRAAELGIEYYSVGRPHFSPHGADGAAEARTNAEAKTHAQENGTRL